MSQDVSQDDFQKEVLEAEGLVMVDFWASWCAPCRALSPLLEQIEEESKGQVKVAKVNVDENQQIAMQHGVQGIPTVKFFKDGKEIETWVGLMPKQHYQALIEKHA